MAQDPPSKPSIPPFNSKSVGALVKQHREYKKLSQGDLAKAADVAKQAISNLERGTVVPTMTTLRAIATSSTFPWKSSSPPASAKLLPMAT